VKHNAAPVLYYLKLGGSLITEKSQPLSARAPTIHRLAGEIAAALLERQDLRLILGHGSGSFGHATARKYATQAGVATNQQWRGFAEVWRAANLLNRIVVDALAAMGLPVIALSPAAMITAENHHVLRWDLTPLHAALQAGLLPVIQGDVVFDTALGGTILSTEDLFVHLARHLPPQRVLLAGIEAGVWQDFPACTRLVDSLTPALFQDGQSRTLSLQASAAPDVTGGMAAKVAQSIEMVSADAQVEVFIFSAEEEQVLYQALLGQNVGTHIHR